MLVVVATDLLACTLVAPPGDWGADVVVGTSQRFGVPMMSGGPHAAFLATTQRHARYTPRPPLRSASYLLRGFLTCLARCFLRMPQSFVPTCCAAGC